MTPPASSPSSTQPCGSGSVRALAPAANGPVFEIAQPMRIVSCACAPDANNADASAAADNALISFISPSRHGAFSAHAFFSIATCLYILRAAAHSVKDLRRLSQGIGEYDALFVLSFPGKVLRYGLAVRRTGPQLRRCAQILVRSRDVRTQFLGSHPGPVRVFEHRAAECDLIGLAPRDDGLGLFCGRDQSDHA